MNLATLDLHLKFIKESLENDPLANSIMMIGDSSIFTLVNKKTATQLQEISSKLSDIKGELSGIILSDNLATQHAGNRQRKTQRKIQQYKRLTSKNKIY